MRAPRWALLSLALLAACGGDDDATPADAGFTGDVGSCDFVGPLRACAPRCDDPCAAGSSCIFDLGLCLPAPVDEQPGLDTCALAEGDLEPRQHYCWGADAFCAFTAPPGPVGVRTGTCVPRALCDDVPSDRPFECVYSDGLPYESGPPPYEGECAGEPRFGFCGGPCGDCMPSNRFDDWRFCVGLDETRGVGVCAVSERRCDVFFPQAGLGRDPDLACLLTRGEREPGWIVRMDTCRAYRERFPAVSCLDANGLEAP